MRRFWGMHDRTRWPDDWDSHWRMWLHNDGQWLRVGIQVNWPRIYIEVAKWELGIRLR